LIASPFSVAISAWRMPDRLLITGLVGHPRAILITDGLIEALDGDGPSGVPTIDAEGLSAAPGFIELQVNGVGDADFTADPASIGRGAAMLPRHGVTSFLATVVTSPRGTVEAALAALPAAAAPDAAVPLGLHVEGPFISPRRLGAHDPAARRDPNLDEIREWLGGGVRMLTLAPELPGGLGALELIATAGAIGAIGHTDADAATAARAIDAGARYATHLFNAMPPLDHREPGPVGAILADERVVVGLIADGVHVHPLVLGTVARAAAGRVSLVSDAVATRLGGRALTHLPDGARFPDGTLAGGSAGLDHGVRGFAGIAGRDAALAAVTEVPARLLGLDDGRGTLRVGGRADIVLLTDDLDVAATIIGGHVAFRSPGAAAPGPAQA
jgi:N-acetylglucosamine-6-phosphate deacetylase